MREYNHKKIEKKWQRRWDKSEIYKARDFSAKPKYYCLIEFPYPSGAGLHIGHLRSHIAIDIVARKRRMSGYNVLYPIGWDAFGLPTENYAIKTKTHPKIVTRRNIKNFIRQIKSYGPSFDWSREINTTDPAYYKWTQWIFLKLFNSFYDDRQNKARPIEELKVPKNLSEEEKRKYIDSQRMAYEAEMAINWCPSCKIGLANEEVVNGNCERCGEKVERKMMKQWMLRITKYAQRLIEDLDTVDYLDKIKTQQINWIGRSEGAIIKFKVQSSKFKGWESEPAGRNSELKAATCGSQLQTKSRSQNDSQFFVEIFTTRPDTLFGCTYLVLAPEHPMIESLKNSILNLKEVREYIKKAKNKSDLDRTDLAKEKTGVELKGIEAVNPATGERIPVWVADYVLATYGTGAIMAVPAHDSRDWEFAKKYKLSVKKVIIPEGEKSQNSKPKQGDSAKSKSKTGDGAYEGEGVLINSAGFTGMTSEKARKEITKWLKENKLGRKAVSYKLRDWVFSRQHYWGEPIPIIKCGSCGNVPLKEKDLPLRLPNVKKYEPTDTGESPLAKIKKWVNVKCPRCGGKARRETDTMPNWAGSSWYFLRYTDPKNNKRFASRKKIEYWMPVDLYNGGMEHTTLHLLYSRFWHKFLYDLGYVNTPEPYKMRRSHGMILAEDGQKMSKSRGNVINPDDIIEKYGADTLRLYEMFMGPYSEAIPWNTSSLIGMRRFLERVWELKRKVQSAKRKAQERESEQLKRLLHKTIKKVSEDIDNLKFNTAISQLMILVGEMEKQKRIQADHYKLLIVLLAPFAPHITEEIWEMLGNKKSIHLQPWPVYDEELAREKEIELVVQVNGKVRDRVKVPVGISEEEARKIAFESRRIKKWIEGKKIRKVIFARGRLVNIVVS